MSRFDCRAIIYYRFIYGFRPGDCHHLSASRLIRMNAAYGELLSVPSAASHLSAAKWGRRISRRSIADNAAMVKTA